MDVVVGSGPSGLACASALLDRGRTVCMIDGGIRLDPDRADVVSRMRDAHPGAWAEDDLAEIKQGMNPSAAGIPEKLVFGSNFPYRRVKEELNVREQGVRLRSSLALGGLSTVWGAAMLPYCEADIGDWPVTAAQLAPHYAAAEVLAGMSAADDDLATMFPLHTPARGRLAMSRQADVVWKNLSAHRDRLRADGIHFGHSRLAIRSAHDARAGCVHCGLCMFGCPYGHIFNAGDVVASWRGRDRFTYRAGMLAETVSESGGCVTIRGRELESGSPFALEADRVFLAAGVAPTTSLLLRSMSAVDRTVHIKDSQYFLFPAVLLNGVGRVRGEALHALSQVFIEINNARVSKHMLHLQLYTYSELIGRAIGSLFGPFRRILDPITRLVEPRIVMLQGFVHSAESSTIAVTRRMEAGREHFDFRAVVNPEARRVVRRALRKLFALAPRLGIVPIPPVGKLPRPGRGFHIGGSFPMRAHPGEFETDTLGRPAGWTRVHAVDATVFPSVAATTITLTAMANAHRIGTHAADL